MTHPNEVMVRDCFAAFGRGDLDAIRTYLAEDVHLHYPGRGAFGGDHEGADRVIGTMAKQAELAGGTYRTELHDVLANDDRAVALHTVRAERAGKKLEIATILIFRIRDGKMSEIWIMFSDLYAEDEFWA